MQTYLQLNVLEMMNLLDKTCGAPGPADELEALTRAYARYSRSAGGLGSVVGGTLCLASYFIGALLPLNPAVRAVLIVLPFAWLGAKLWLTRHYYQRFGRVEEQETRYERLTYWFCVAVSVLVALGITVVSLIGVSRHPGQAPAGLAGYLALIWLLPLAAWRWMRSAMDFIIGVFLICQAALACVGQSYPMIGLTHGAEAAKLSLIAVMFPLVGLVMIAAGIAEHHRFQSIRARLEALQQGSGTNA